MSLLRRARQTDPYTRAAVRRWEKATPAGRRQRTVRRLRLWGAVLVTAVLLLAAAGLVGAVLALQAAGVAPLAWALAVVVVLDVVAVFVMWRATHVR